MLLVALLGGFVGIGGTDAAALRRTLDQVNGELERIENALERIPSLGLVTDRGGDG